jgi:hypothetical protein
MYMNISMTIFFYKFLLILLYLVSYQSSHITFRIIQSSVLHFMPSIKLHHIVLLSDKPKYYVYTLDFTPINQTHSSTLLKMLLAQNVPGEVRLRYIESNIENNETIIQKWDNMNKVDEHASYKLSKSVYNTKIYNKQIQNIVNTAFKWLPYMNLYNHNCQHFGRYVTNVYRTIAAN